MDLRDRLRAAIEERLNVARGACRGGAGRWHQTEADRESGRIEDERGDVVTYGWEVEHIAANDPAFVIRACERDLKVLERHPACVNCHPNGDLDWTHPLGCHRCASTWPCEPIRDLAEQYAVDLTEEGQGNGS
jgi:hypothetical protein